MASSSSITLNVEAACLDREMIDHFARVIWDYAKGKCDLKKHLRQAMEELHRSFAGNSRPARLSMGHFGINPDEGFQAEVTKKEQTARYFEAIFEKLRRDAATGNYLRDKDRFMERADEYIDMIVEETHKSSKYYSED